MASRTGLLKRLASLEAERGQVTTRVHYCYIPMDAPDDTDLVPALAKNGAKAAPGDAFILLRAFSTAETEPRHFRTAVLSQRGHKDAVDYELSEEVKRARLAALEAELGMRALTGPDGHVRSVQVDRPSPSAAESAWSIPAFPSQPQHREVSRKPPPPLPAAPSPHGAEAPNLYYTNPTPAPAADYDPLGGR